MDQAGFIRNRQTLVNIRKAVHIINHNSMCDFNEKKSSVILGLDAEKAFDLVGWDFLFQ